MIIELNGLWKMKDKDSDNWLNANVPGCNFTDLMTNGIIPDPFIGTNEQDVQWVGEKDWEYKREFSISEDELNHDIIELVAESLDTLASVFINDSLALTSANAHRLLAVDIKPYLRVGMNTIHIVFLSPNKYIKEGQRLVKYPYNNMGLHGVPHIRKNQSHFGWDWGPILPLSGITRNIYIKCVNKGKIIDVRVKQEHYQNKVRLDIDITAYIVRKEEALNAQVNITAPDGRVTTEFCALNDNCSLCIEINNPELWEANGMSDRVKQPLYQVEVSIKEGDTTLDVKRLNIGLRTIALNTTKDKWGGNFQFLVNGIPLFCRGANWIPADSFATRLTREKIDYLVRSAKDSNMNMIRVWGGGFYESEDFYNACDSYGILVWQDFGFACMPYDFDNRDFVQNVKQEVIDNVIRLRNRASLALWCGNNEIELLSKLWITKRHFIKSTGEFFYKTLAEWVSALDGITPYWYGSPSSGKYMKDVNSDSVGDTHLWQVWHGLKPYNYYRKRFTRFCSEFGFESLPDIETIEKFAEKEDYHMNSAVMLNHQKCKSGNNKILYYITTRFRIPEKFSDLVYLSQISQMESIRDATEHWRRNMKICSGALYWQLNDCWPVNSWSSIDYYGRWKALQYQARKFNSPITLSIEDNKYNMSVHIVNDTMIHKSCEVYYKVITFSGEVLDSGEIMIDAVPLASSQILTKDYSSLLKSSGQANRAVFVTGIKGDEYSERTALFVKEKYANLDKAVIEKDIEVNNGVANIKVKASTFARFVMVKVKNINEPLSDNYFDLLPNQEKVITVKVNKEMKAKDINVSLIALNNIVPKWAMWKDSLFRFKVRAMPINLLYAIAQMFS